MRHRDLLELIDALPRGADIEVEIADLWEAVEDHSFGSEGRRGLRNPISVHEVRKYANVLEERGVRLYLEASRNKLEIYKP